eukprot:CAMPEP_0172486114 /NCGR_PEP_ID=MMETSP1066-20121228/14530_1 /TAXON_ID=671091 /ORGANISM="Coscinodiscus wailesii, Strain CCMP2513" /LENGTH=220 /DNA_ID=CAMNT_0013251853 /DNA_START=101 /DNA_END=763 /DNA_ORIENTATION=-
MSNLLHGIFDRTEMAYGSAGHPRRSPLTTQIAFGSVTAHKQKGGTCYANAASTCVRSTLMRIEGIKVPSFEELRDQVIQSYGTEGGSAESAINDLCKIYGIHSARINHSEAETAVQNGRYVCGSFWLSHEHWDEFTSFFKQYPKGVLRSKLPHYDGGEGHAVAIVGQTKDYWKIKNSWGGKWADQGYFRVEKSALELKFIDVYFTLADLRRTGRYIEEVD